MGNGRILNLASTVAEDLKKRLPNQRETQRENLALHVGTMLSVRRSKHVSKEKSTLEKLCRIVHPT